MNLDSASLAISATAHDRPGHLGRLLESLVRAQRTAHWPVYLGIEPTARTPEILAVIESYRDRLPITFRVNEQKKGVRRNPHDNVQWVVDSGHTAVLLLEDDLVIDRLALRWCEAVLDQGLLNERVLCANLLLTTCNSLSIFTPHADEVDSLADLVVRTRFFSSYGLLFTAAHWQRHFVPNWFTDTPCMLDWRGQKVTGWDVAMNRVVLTHRELQVLQSLVPRVTHDGAGGTHVRDGFQAASFDHVRLDLGTAAGLNALQVVDPLAASDAPLTPQARMYLNACQHLWTLQESALLFSHDHDDRGDKRPKRFRLGSYEYIVHRRKLGRRAQPGAQKP